MLEYLLMEVDFIMQNEELKLRIISIALSVTFLTGFVLGKLDNKQHNSSESNNVTIVSDDKLGDKCLDDYIEKRDTLEEEIKSLSEQKERLRNDETFDAEKLIVIENSNVDNESNLYILKPLSSEIYEEYHNVFCAWYKAHSESEQHYYFCLKYVHFDECQPLINYLNDSEIEKLANNNGEITTSELDEILARIRTEYREQMSKDAYSRNLSNN